MSFHSWRPSTRSLSIPGLIATALLNARASAQQEYLRWEGVKDEQLGLVVESAGDLDHDGTPDLILAGLKSVHVYSGRTGTLLYDIAEGNTVLASPIVDLDGDGTADLLIGDLSANQVHACSGIDGHLIFTASLPTGRHTALLGIDDTDGDGVPDYAVGLWLNGSGNSGSVGEINVYSGSTQHLLYEIQGLDVSQSPALLTGDLRLGSDLNGDGQRELLFTGLGSGVVSVISPGPGTPLFKLLQPFPGSAFFPSCAADAGDFDNDGVRDVIVGDSNGLDSTGNRFGAAYVFSGATQQLLHTFDGGGATGFGFALDRVPHVDSDGVDDFLISNFQAFGGRSNSSFLFSGAMQSLLYAHTSSPLGTHFGAVVRSVGDLNGDGFGDYAISAPLEGSIHQNGVVRVFLGNDLFLDAEPTTMPEGSVGSLSLRDGVPFGLNLVAVVEVNGTPLFDALFGLQTFDANGSWTFTDTVAPGLSGTTFVFVGYANDANGHVIESARETIIIP